MTTSEHTPSDQRAGQAGPTDRDIANEIADLVEQRLQARTGSDRERSRTHIMFLATVMVCGMLGLATVSSHAQRILGSQR